jgi:hypothetical protein
LRGDRNAGTPDEATVHCRAGMGNGSRGWRCGDEHLALRCDGVASVASAAPAPASSSGFGRQLSAFAPFLPTSDVHPCSLSLSFVNATKAVVRGSYYIIHLIWCRLIIDVEVD